MNLPNKLTLLRVLLIPVLFVFYYLKVLSPWNYLIVFIIFILASFTDMLDGKIARKYNLVTSFGKFMDPIADKILVISALLILAEKGYFGIWVLVIVIAREFAVSGVRLIASIDGGQVIAASKLGKYKTATQMVSVSVLLFVMFMTGIELREKVKEIFESYVYYVGIVLLYISVALTFISGFEYLYKNRKLFVFK